MWGRISNIAAKLDDSFGVDDGDVDVDGAANGAAAAGADARASLADDDPDGWGSEGDLDEDLDFGSDEDELSENGAAADGEANGSLSVNKHELLEGENVNGPYSNVDDNLDEGLDFGHDEDGQLEKGAEDSRGSLNGETNVSSPVPNEEELSEEKSFSDDIHGPHSNCGDAATGGPAVDGEADGSPPVNKYGSLEGDNISSPYLNVGDLDFGHDEDGRSEEGAEDGRGGLNGETNVSSLVPNEEELLGERSFSDDIHGPRSNGGDAVTGGPSAEAEDGRRILFHERDPPSSGISPAADEMLVEGGADTDAIEGEDARERSPLRNDGRDDAVTASAPGKALVAGGYLVLESPNPGVVLAAEGCRFYATVALRPRYAERGGVIGSSVDPTWESIPLDVYSPQFDQVFSYYLVYPLTTHSKEDGVSLRLQPRRGPQDPNAFLEWSILLALGYLRQCMGAEAFHRRLRQRGSDGADTLALAIKLRADNNFYSQIPHLRQKGWDATVENLERLEPFSPCPKDPLTGELLVNKTGMGSSAAMVTSIVGALLQFFGVVCLPSGIDSNGENTTIPDPTCGFGRGLRIAHHLSQICHCHAQGKVGSGFDVSAAVYGSQVYTRFSKGVLEDFLKGLSSTVEGEEQGIQLSTVLSGQLVRLVNDTEWDCTVRPVSLPPGVELLMADVCGGSETPSMARIVLDWKKNKRKLGFTDDFYWRDLKRRNQKIVSVLTEQFSSPTFLDGLRRDGAVIVSARTAAQWKKPMPSTWHTFEGSSWDVALKLLDLRAAFLECRQNLKGMGASAGAPVEPDAQSALADATMRLPGVIAAGVPGAGGFDALYVLYVEGPSTKEGRSDRVRDEIGTFFHKRSGEKDQAVVCPLSVRAARAGDGLSATRLDW